MDYERKTKSGTLDDMRFEIVTSLEFISSFPDYVQEELKEQAEAHIADVDQSIQDAIDFFRKYRS